MRDLEFLTQERVIEIHEQILAKYPGLPGLAVDKSIESVLARITNKISYGEISTVFEIAAMYGIALAQGHAFIDGNKRTGLIAIYDFLEIAQAAT